jgi:hypothetical protein
MKIKLKMSMFRKLGDDDFENIYKSDYATYCYIALRYMSKSNVDLTTTPRLIYIALTEKEPTRTDIQGIKQGLQILADSDVIYYNTFGTTYSINTENLEILKGEKYFFIDSDYLYKVMEQKNGVKLIHHYSLLCSTINVLNNMGCHTREYFAEALNINTCTVSERHKLFQKLGIIAFSEHRNGVNKKGDFVNLPKIYVMPCNVDLLDELQEKAMQKSIKDSNRTINRKKKEAKQKQEIVEHEQDAENPFENEVKQDEMQENKKQEIPQWKQEMINAGLISAPKQTTTINNDDVMDSLCPF